MKLVTYLHNGHEQLALLVGDVLYDTDSLHPELPSSMNMFLNYWEDCYPLAQNCERAILDGRISPARGIDSSGVDRLAPVPLPVSVRIADAAGPSGSLPASLPVLRHTDHQAIKGPGELEAMPDQLQNLIPGGSAAIVICRAGRNLSSAEADAFIGGLMIMNSFQAPSFQSGETALAQGPWLVTPDELESFEIPPLEGHVGRSWNLAMSVTINGQSAGTGNIGELKHSFAECIERASYGRDLFPGEIIACPLANTPQNLHAGDVVEVTIQGLGTLTNTIVAEESGFSLLDKGKTAG